MNKEENKNAVSKLTIKILLSLFAALLIVFALIAVLFFILRGTGLTEPGSSQDFEGWFRAILAFFQVATGLGIFIIFSLIINKLIVKRICELEEATKQIAKGNLGISVPVTGSDEIADLTASFNQMSTELKANEYLSKEFVRNVSHEFKTPISAIKAYAGLLDEAAEGGKLDAAAAREYAGVIIKESDRLTAMTKSILQLSMLDSTTIIKREDTFSPAAQVREILRLMQGKWMEKNLTLDLQMEEVTITNNEQLLYQVWQNLISNAIKFSADGGEVKIVLQKTETGVRFEITDSGAGIKKEDKEKIFDHFYMADASRNTEGNGLGLPIVKKILTKIGGTINFESEEGKGSKFIVMI